MAKRHNMKAEKAKRNAEYALKFKKKKRPQARRPMAFSSSSPAIAPDGTTARMSGHEAICAACGVQTTLPFKPVSGKPVFCRACFTKEPPPVASSPQLARPSQLSEPSQPPEPSQLSQPMSESA